MHVLEAAAPVVRGTDPDELLHAVVPALGQVLRVEVAEQELLLETEAEDDVQPVRRLVRVDADQGRARPVDRAVERLERDVLEDGEAGSELRVEPPPELHRAPDHVLPEPALRLVQRG